MRVHTTRMQCSKDLHAFVCCHGALKQQWALALTCCFLIVCVRVCVCVSRAPHAALGLDPNVFYNTWVLLAVHIWLILNRLEKDDSRLGKAWKKRVYDLWQEDLRHRMYSAGVQVSATSL